MGSARIEAATSVLHPATRMGAVQLTVANLERSLAFYQQVLGFQLHRRTSDSAHLGAGRVDLLELVEVPGARQVSHHSGLYHFAVLTPSRLALGQVLRNLVEYGIPIGGSDHLVSEAIYLSDPDGIGIEIYRDRPRDQWRYAGGQPVMGNQPLDYQALLCGLVNESTKWSGLAPETTIGHIHLHVDHLPPAITFYRDTLGFDLVTTWHNAAFFAAGGYHHHLAANTWAGVGAPPQPADAGGLRHFVLTLADHAERTRLIERLQRDGLAWEERGDGLFVRDPAQNGILFTVAERDG